MHEAGAIGRRRESATRAAGHAGLRRAERTRSAPARDGAAAPLDLDQRDDERDHHEDDDENLNPDPEGRHAALG
jgi:hypothetical protein